MSARPCLIAWLGAEPCDLTPCAADHSLGNPTDGFSGIEMFVAGDQLLKGAAQNAVQIAELLLEK